MNSSFRIKDPSHYIDLGVPSSLTQPFPKDHKIKLFIEPYLNGQKKDETSAYDHKQKEKLLIEPYSLSIVSRRAASSSSKKEESPKRPLENQGEHNEEEVAPLNKKRRLIQYVHHREGSISSTKDRGPKGLTNGEKRKKECDNAEESSSAWIKLSNGQVIRVPQSMLLNIQLLKQKASSVTPLPVSKPSSLPKAITNSVAASPSLPLVTSSMVVKEKKGVVMVAAPGSSSSPLTGSGTITLNNKQQSLPRKVGIVSNTIPTVKPPSAATLVQPVVKSVSSSSPILLTSTLQKEAHIKASSLKGMPIGVKKTVVALDKPPTSTISLGKSLSSIVANSQLPQSHIIALKTQEKNGQVIYLKSIPNQKPPTPGATRLIVTQPAAPNQRLNVNHQVLSHSGSGIQLPLKTTVKSSSSDGLSTSTRSPILVKRIIPSELPICNSQAKQGKSCSNSVGSPINGKYRDIMKLSTTLKHVLSQTTVPNEEVEMPKEASKSSRSMVILKSDHPLTNTESNSKSYDHDYSITPRGSKLSEVLTDISKRGIFVETTAVKVDSCNGDKISTMDIALPQKDLLSFVISKTRKEGNGHNSSQQLFSGSSTPETSSSPSRKVLLSKSSKLSRTPEQQRVLTTPPGSKKTMSKRQETFYIDEALPQGWFVQSKFNPGLDKNEIYHITSNNMRLRPGRELCDYILHGIVPYSRATKWVGPKVSLKAMPVRKAVVVCESLCE